MLRNPCKKCLVKVCCKSWCEEKNNYEDFCAHILPIILFTISCLLVISSVIILITLIKKYAISFVVLSIIWIICFIINKKILELEFSISDIIKNENSVIQDLVGLYILAPIILTTFALHDCYESYMNERV